MLDTNKIMNLTALSHWNVEDPNDIAKSNTIKVCAILNKDPIVIAPTIECGAYLSFTFNNLELICECYNDGDIGIVILKDRNIIYNEDILNFDFKEVLTFINNNIK